MACADAPLFGAAPRVAVRLPVPVDAPYDYAVPDDLAPLSAGDIVRVPLGRRIEVGVVWGEGAADVPETKLRAVLERLDVPPMPAALRDLVDWCAAYTLAPAGQVLRMALSVPEALDPPKPRVGHVARLTDLGKSGLRITEARRKGAGRRRRMAGRRAAALGRRSGPTRGRRSGGGQGPRRRRRAGTRPGGRGPRGRTARPPPARADAVARPGRAADTLRGPCAAAFRSHCWRASPAPARPRFISRPSPRPWRRVGRRWSCCRKSP